MPELTPEDIAAIQQLIRESESTNRREQQNIPFLQKIINMFSGQ